MPARIYDSLADVERHGGPLRSGDRTIVYSYLDLGLSARQCARRLHVSASFVLRRLDVYGIARRPPGGSRPRLGEEQLRRAAFLYERLGLSLAQVASFEGINPNAVRHRLQAAGVAMRRPGRPPRHQSLPAV